VFHEKGNGLMGYEIKQAFDKITKTNPPARRAGYNNIIKK